MYDSNDSKNHSPICDFVPGHAYYSKIGDGIAESLLSFIEYFVDIIDQFRR